MFKPKDVECPECGAKPQEQCYDYRAGDEPWVGENHLDRVIHANKIWRARQVEERAVWTESFLQAVAVRGESDWCISKAEWALAAWKNRWPGS